MLIWNWCQAIEASMEWMAASDMAAVVAVKVRRRLGLGIWATFHVCKLRLDGKVVFNLQPNLGLETCTEFSKFQQYRGAYITFFQFENVMYSGMDTPVSG